MDDKKCVDWPEVVIEVSTVYYLFWERNAKSIPKLLEPTDIRATWLPSRGLIHFNHPRTFAILSILPISFALILFLRTFRLFFLFLSLKLFRFLYFLNFFLSFSGGITKVKMIEIEYELFIHTRRVGKLMRIGFFSWINYILKRTRINGLWRRKNDFTLICFLCFHFHN